MRKKCLMIVLIGIYIYLSASFSVCSAENYPYNKIIPTDADLSQTLAEQYAVDYYSTQAHAQGGKFVIRGLIESLSYGAGASAIGIGKAYLSQE